MLDWLLPTPAWAITEPTTYLTDSQIRNLRRAGWIIERPASQEISIEIDDHEYKTRVNEIVENAAIRAVDIHDRLNHILTIKEKSKFRFQPATATIVAPHHVRTGHVKAFVNAGEQRGQSVVKSLIFTEVVSLVIMTRDPFLSPTDNEWRDSAIMSTTVSVVDDSTRFSDITEVFRRAKLPLKRLYHLDQIDTFGPVPIDKLVLTRNFKHGKILGILR